MGEALRVLLVDDYDPFRSCVARYLRKRLGAEVIEVGDGADALAQQNGPFDVVLLDVDMPHLDGAATYAQLRPELARRTLLVTSGPSHPELIDFVRAFDPERVFVKPVDLERLVTAVTTITTA